MAVISYPFQLNSDAGLPVPGATTSITTVKALATGVTIGVTPPITDLGDGDYVVAYDPEVNGDAKILIAASRSGVTMTGRNAAVSVFATREPSRTLTALPNALLDIAGALNAAPPGALTPESIAESVVLARAVLAGKATVSADGKSVSWTRHDGTTSAVTRTYPSSILATPALPETVTTTA